VGEVTNKMNRSSLSSFLYKKLKSLCLKQIALVLRLGNIIMFFISVDVVGIKINFFSTKKNEKNTQRRLVEKINMVRLIEKFYFSHFIHSDGVTL
jgi:hypothetical protein